MKKIHKHLLTGLILMILLFLAIGSSDNSDSKKTTKDPRTQRIESQFSQWDGSHRNLVKLIKESMNDAKSFEHVETSYWDMGEYLIVKTTFRGKNAFGGVVKNWVKAKVDLDGNILEVLEQGP